MTGRLDFSYNWNNKLSCQAHTTLRLRNDAKYIIGNRYEEYIKEKKLQEIVIADIKHLYLQSINDFIAYVDTGYSRSKCIELIQTMYKNKNINWQEQQLSLILCVVDKNTIEFPEAANNKIALFCRMYEHYTKVKYKASAADSGKIKLIEVTQELLEHYFTSDNFLFRNKYSITNLTKYYNELRAEMAMGKVSANTRLYKNSYDAQYATKLSMPELGKYYEHLRSLGLVAKHDRLGNLIDFVKSPQQ